jgi:WD40 repeat protein
MATDMSKFVAAFASPISQSTPHIYLSALPFVPVDSTLSKHYLPKYQQTLSIQIGGERDWPTIQNIMVEHTDWVRAVSFSPDGAHIVSGSDDRTIRIWDAQTGSVASVATSRIESM